MSQDQDADRSEAATPHKLDEARKRGQVPKSQEMASAISLLVAAMTFHAIWHDRAQLLLQYFNKSMSLVPDIFNEGDSIYFFVIVAGLVREVVLIMAPALLMVVFGAMLGHQVQVGILWSWDPVKPDWQRLNPVRGIKRLVNAKILFDTVRTLFKFFVIVLVSSVSLVDSAPRLAQLGILDARAQLFVLLREAGSMALKVAGALFVLAFLDLAYSRREFARKMRMSHRDIRDEHKNREGDPRVRSRIKMLRREMLKQVQSLKNTANADIVITNPTHVAVALRYQHGEMAAPVTVCKGVGIHAWVIRRIAAKHGIPVLCSPSLARSLNKYAVLDKQIPVKLYSSVARLVVWNMSRQDAGLTKQMVLF